ncbi:nuclease-related domain-containing protein [Ruficoccus sp. ZRK36]|uniref:nuclease-related domain-containing protein n=1 Tax=Ruficoccus sp. ZRK36 TaxID=2866311 RepID=UPI001C7321F9|nr:nuclease-related domain-containing protein [Ruficoccus sp. ZRK36]QYY37413.1 NERD domain-containing protein [Ruficoccus sp. ZRK36]
MSLLKGWLGEKMTSLGIWATLDKQCYPRFHDVIAPSTNGTTQIDHVIVSRVGIFVIETKNYSGWIFGGEKQAKWTQSLYGKKSSFQNPLHQNYRHIKCLSASMGVAGRPFPLRRVFHRGMHLQNRNARQCHEPGPGSLH